VRRFVLAGPAAALNPTLSLAALAEPGIAEGLPAETLAALGGQLAAELRALLPLVAPPLVRQQLLEPQPARICGEYWRGSVLFADMSGFTALSERLASLGREGAEEVRRIISALFAALLDELHLAGGDVLKFGGDALTVFFDASTLGESHAALACRAALAMQGRMAEYASFETRAGPATLRLRIGVHSGRIFAAQVGDADHVELVVSGRQINRVALAQEIAEPGEVVVSAETLALLEDAAHEARQRGFFLLRAARPPSALPAEARLPVPAQAATPEALRGQARLALALYPYLARRLPERFLSGEGEQGTEGEFRPVSVLFANFYPFSNLLEALGEDVDTAARALNCYYRRAQAVVHAYDGIVNKVDMATFGDKLMALFGAPTAHEDDAERAVRAALDLSAALREANQEIADLLGAEPNLRQRIGINTGAVFAGLVGGRARREYTVMGSSVNLAARLMGAAEEGCVLLSPSTRRVVAQRFLLEDLEPVALKGLAEPIRPAAALGLREVLDSDAGPAGPLDLAPFVGRDRELDQALDLAALALDGAGRTLAIVGDAGTGKSRLVEELLFRLVPADPRDLARARPFMLYSAECQSYQQNTPYAPVRALLRRLLGLADQPQPQALDLIARRVGGLVPELSRFMPLLAELLNLDAEETPLIDALSPEQRRDRLHELVAAIITAEAEIYPLVLLFDDIQWADDASLALIAHLAGGLAATRALLLLAYRPDGALAESWAEELPQGTAIRLRELDESASAELAAGILGGALPRELAPLIERAQGNPFFIEELIRTLAEKEALERDEQGSWQLRAGHALDQLPDTIEGIITARLDLLGDSERDVLQVASVIGRRFPYVVLSRIYERAEILPPALGHLDAGGIILPDEGAAAYLFRQALTREVAYESILFARRRELNGRVARAIERQLGAGESRDEYLAPLARYYLLAEEWQPALRYHIAAGTRAAEQFANRSAITLFEQALAIVPRIAGLTPDQALAPGWEALGDGLAVQACAALEQLGQVLSTVGEYDAALERFEQTRALLESKPLPDLQQIARTYRLISSAHERKGTFETAFAALAHGRALLGLEPSVELARIYLLGAGLYHRQGNYLDSIEWAEHARILAEKVGSPRDEAHAYKLIGANRHGLGENQAAIENTRRSLETYRQINDLAGLAGAYNNLAGILHDIGDWEQAQQAYRAAAELEESIGNRYGQAMIANNLGEVLRSIGDLDGAIEQYRIAERAWSASQYGSAVIAMNLGATYLLRSDLEAAQTLLAHSRTIFGQIGVDDFLPELLRYVAELQLAQGDAEAALATVREAATLAEQLETPLEQGVARRVEARALIALAREAEAQVALQAALALLREVGNRHELGRTLLLVADLSATGDSIHHAEGIFAEAVALFAELGARLDLEHARSIAERHGFGL
jgi:class 3 adenylate cyclase/predicted ATPase